MRRNIILIGFIFNAILILMSISLFAAEQKNPEAPEKVDQSAAQEGTKKADSYYEYSGVGRRDPFTSLIQKKGSGREKGATALESYDSSEMKLIAILWNKDRYYGVLSLPDGKSYTVYEGIKVGVGAGVIKKISKDSLTIAERVKDARGRMVPKQTVLKLRLEEE
jgi:Tfp pilus assembly protein PilP